MAHGVAQALPCLLVLPQLVQAYDGPRPGPAGDGPIRSTKRSRAEASSDCRTLALLMATRSKVAIMSHMVSGHAQHTDTVRSSTGTNKYTCTCMHAHP